MSIHRFTPAQYYITIGSHEPALHIADGDTVETTTVDARGFDAAGEQVAARGNPQTGPFYIDGAEPGDTLAVHFDRLYPNRPHGFTGGYIAPNVVDPDFYYHQAMPESDRCEWDIDLEKGTTTLVSPETKLGRFTLPMVPMLGCFGVAPARGEALSTATSGPHGGNMDYRGFKQGVTVYFPVFVPGALLHVGDGHAIQGDGEIVGTGVEVSFDVRFTVRLIKGKKAALPRAENDEYIMTAGNARPLDQCVQHATSEMVRWLQEDYGLEGIAAHILLGQCVEYDLGNIFDPAYTMICKIAKKYLPDRRTVHEEMRGA